MNSNKFIEKFEQQVKKTIQKYKLTEKKDKILVAMSGGKDSTVVAYLLKKFGFYVEGLHINLLMGNWSEQNLENIRKFCKEQGINLHIYSIRKEIGCSVCYLKSIVKEKTNLRDCTICGIVRRWLINKKARLLGATKIATGHNLDDEAQTVLMNIFKGNPTIGLKQGPLTGVVEENKFVPRIKPLFFCEEKDIKKYSEIMKFPVLYQRCPCVIGALRHGIRNQLDSFEIKNKNVKENIVKNWFEIKKGLIKNIKVQEVLHCERCGEPTRNKICKACLIMEKIK